MRREYYNNSIKEFLKTDQESLVGQLLIHDVFETTDLQKNAWIEEVKILKEQLADFPDGHIIFEYTIPRIGSRIDVVCIIKGILFLLEFKVGDALHRKSTANQVMDYALDLKYFHEYSRERYIVPVAVATEAETREIKISDTGDQILDVIFCNKDTIQEAITAVLTQYSDQPLPAEEWMESKYKPTPTIIEAAQKAYRSHTVKDITRNDAEAINLNQTIAAIDKIVEQCKEKHEKAICFVTGVPGAGKTLVGLQIASERQNYDQEEHAVFLSGNGPLVDVLHEALAIDQKNRESVTKEEAKRKIKLFIQNIHKYRDAALTRPEAPNEKIAIFDEAQRAWDEPSLTDFMKKKKNTLDFNKSEPEFLISIMDRHEDWATIICLVGGGQEIYKGEAGIREWLEALNNGFANWKIYLSDQMSGAEYVGDSTIKELLSNREYTIERNLHLSVSQRSFRSNNLAAFTKALLDHDTETAKEQYNILKEQYPHGELKEQHSYEELKERYPLYITRNLETAKQWVREKSRGTERYGLLASSEGKRLRANGIWVLPSIKHVQWFLGEEDHVDSSYRLEVVATEFQVQGLEIDYGILAWDGDMRIQDGAFAYYHFRGDTWCHTKTEQKKRYTKNAYRVLLTRARQGLIIYIPEGSDTDPTTAREIYDGTYNYFKEIGVEEI